MKCKLLLTASALACGLIVSAPAFAQTDNSNQDNGNALTATKTITKDSSGQNNSTNTDNSNQGNNSSDNSNQGNNSSDNSNQGNSDSSGQNNSKTVDITKDSSGQNNSRTKTTDNSNQGNDSSNNSNQGNSDSSGQNNSKTADNSNQGNNSSDNSNQGNSDSSGQDNSKHVNVSMSTQDLAGTVSGISLGTPQRDPGTNSITTGNIDMSGSAFSGIQTASVNTGIGSLNQAATALSANANISFGAP